MSNNYNQQAGKNMQKKRTKTENKIVIKNKKYARNFTNLTAASNKMKKMSAAVTLPSKTHTLISIHMYVWVCLWSHKPKAKTLSIV